MVEFGEVKVLIRGRDWNKGWLEEVMDFNVVGIVGGD